MAPPNPPALYTSLHAANAQLFSFPAASATVVTPAATIKATADVHGPPQSNTQLPATRGPPLVPPHPQHGGTRTGSAAPSRGARLRSTVSRVLQGLGPCLSSGSHVISSAQVTSSRRVRRRTAHRPKLPRS